MELAHVSAEQRSKLAEYVLVDGVVLERHLTLYLAVVDDDRTERAARLRGVERGTALPVVARGGAWLYEIRDAR